MKRRLRLRRRPDFDAAMHGHRFHSGRALVGFATPQAVGPAETSGLRIGVTVSRTIRSATDRNRARRRLREVARKKMLGPDSPLRRLGIRYDVVLIARRAALELPFADLEAEAAQAALRLAETKP